MSHDRVCFKCGVEPYDFKFCTKVACPKSPIAETGLSKAIERLDALEKRLDKIIPHSDEPKQTCRQCIYFETGKPFIRDKGYGDGVCNWVGPLPVWLGKFLVADGPDDVEDHYVYDADEPVECETFKQK